jgi:Lrp/AsnC family transcriptional regulator, leucine-responsive regulatory protein
MLKELDETDRKILKLLQADSRLSNKQLAALLHRSPNPTYLRVKRLEDEGYIQKYTVVIDPRKIGLQLIVYTQVQIKPHAEENLTAFCKEVVKLKEVIECSHLTGKFDFLLKIAVRDMNEYNELLMHKLARLPKVDNMESLFVMSEAKHETAYPLD